jgi:hypothetical protein
MNPPNRDTLPAQLVAVRRHGALPGRGGPMAPERLLVIVILVVILIALLFWLL